MTIPAYIVGDDISTDLIHPPNFFSLDQDIRKQGLLYGYNKDWAKTIAPGAIIIAGENFGCGSSREVTAQVFADRQIRLICAKSFARIFQRNMINLGIQTYTISSALPWQDGTETTVYLSEDGLNISDQEGKSIRLNPPSAFVQKIIDCGGLLNAIDDLF